MEYTHTSCIQLLVPATNFLLYLLKHVNDRLSIFAKNVIQKLYNDYHDDVGKLSAGNIHQTSLKVEKTVARNSKPISVYTRNTTNFQIYNNDQLFCQRETFC